MARLEHKYGQTQWVDVHPGDIIPDASGADWIIVTEDMINPGGVLKHSSYFSTTTTSTEEVK